MIKGKLLNKKSAVIAFLLALCMSLTAFAFGRTIARADDLEKVDDKPTEDIVLDMDTTQAWLEVDGAKCTVVHPDNIFHGTPFNDTSVFPDADGSTKITWTEQIGNDGIVAVKFAKQYKAENFSTVTVRLTVGNGAAGNTNVITLNGYALTDTEYATVAGTKEIANGGNVVVDLTLEADKLKDADGYISGFVMKKTETMTGQTGQIFADYVKLAIPAEKEPTENVVVDMDTTQAWLEVDGEKCTVVHPDNVFHGLGDPTVFPKADGSTKITWTEQIANEGVVVVRLANKVKASYFEKVKLNLCVGNGKNGAPAYSNAITITGYAEKDTTFSTPAGKIKTGGGNVTKILSLDPAVLADSDGYIQSIVLRKTETDTECTGQIFADYVEFCLVGSEPKPVISEEFTTKDIADVMPVGAGVTFNVATSEATLNKTIINAAVKAAAFDKLNLKITPNSEGKFSTYVLMKAPTAAATYEDGGIFFWISNDNVVIGNKDNSESVLAAEFPANAFVSGRATKISIAAIPYYIEGTQAGYYCALYVEDATNPLVEIYLGIEDVTTGVYTNICTQDLGGNYSVAYGSASDTPKSASEVMNVRIATKSGSTTFKNPRAALDLTYFEVEGATVSDLVISGNATFDKETGFLTFGKKGTVKVKYTVTNAFGTFESNELTITYDDGKTETKKSGCGSSVAGAGMIGFAALGMAAIAIKKRRK